MMRVMIYRYGFNGKENDNDVKGEGNSVDFGDRIYDPRIGRWLSVDRFQDIYPGWTPYRFGMDNPIFYVDKDGNIEWPLRGTQAINMNDRVWRKGQNQTRDGIIHNQEGYYAGSFSQDYKTHLGKPDANTIIRTSAWSTFRAGGPVNSRKYMSSPHIGTDYRAQTPVNVYSLGDGKISDLGTFKDGNNFIEVTYGNGDKVRFLHLSEFSEGLKKDMKVYEGQVIGKTGESGSKGQPHLHVDAKRKNKPIDPEDTNYGTVTNEEFFGKYGGDYKKLEGYKKDHPTSEANKK
jgi:RHS repeat-associated protein